MDETIHRQVIEIFAQSQYTAAAHQKYSILLRKLYQQSNFDTFIISLQQVIEKLLTVDYKVKNAFVNKICDFFATFCSHLKPNIESEEEDVTEHPLLYKIFEMLLEAECLSSDVIRFRSCTLINKILDSLVGTDISTNLCDQIEDHMLARINDPKVVVRLQAILALHRLQDPSRSGDPIIQEFLCFMDCDPSAKIRQLCIERIAARRDVISHIVLRIRDVDVNVRLAAYKRLSRLTECLKILDKRAVIKNGFLDGSMKIRDYVNKMLIPSWLDHYDGNYLKLMQALRLDADENDIRETVLIIEHVLLTLFRQKPYNELLDFLPLNERKIISFEHLNWETAAYWRIIVQYLRENDELEENVSLVLPELVHFCKYIKSYCMQMNYDVSRTERMEQQFILKQMFLITKGYDISDTASRQSLNALVTQVLEKYDFSSGVVQTIISNLENTIPNIENRSRFVSEIISEIMYPIDSEECEKLELERSYQISQVKMKLDCLMEDQRNAITDEDYIEAERLKKAIGELKTSLQNLSQATRENENIVKKTDIPTITKYLDIAAALLLSPHIKRLTPVLEAMKNDVIQEVLIHENEAVRVKAMHCYALCCVVDKDSAKMGIHIFSAPIFAYKAGEECDTETLLVCIGAVVDLLRIYGSTLMAEPPVEGHGVSVSQSEEHTRVFTAGTSLTELIQGLVDLMDDELAEIQLASGRGLCSLVLSQRVHSPSTISRLVLKWCSPASDDGDGQKLKQMIGLTLEQVAKMSDGIEQLEGAVLMTVKALVSAPQHSPLADVNVDNIASFLLALCRTSIEGEHIHANLAMNICCEMRDRPRNKINLTYSKMLLMLSIPDDKCIVRDLLYLCEGILDDLRDRQTSNNLSKFINTLKGRFSNKEDDIEHAPQEAVEVSIRNI